METTSGRLEAIDQFRGFAILLMILANYLANIELVPAWLKHADDIGYTVIDLIAPMFIFAIGLTYGLSFRRRLERDGAWKTYQHFIIRYMALLGMGFLASLVWELSGIEPPSINWGLLQALGAAGLLTLPFIRLHAAWRWGIGLGILAIYQVLLDRFWLADVMIAPHNGPWGALSWGAMLILATAVADLYHDERLSRRVYPLVSAGLVIAGLALSLLVPLSKHRASASYVILSLGLSGMVFCGFHLLQEFYQRKLPLLTDWGRNPLILYVLHYVILGIYALPDIPTWYVEAPLWLIILQLAALIGILSWVGHYLNQRKLYFAL
jgi:predicted acyltransferase